MPDQREPSGWKIDAQPGPLRRALALGLRYICARLDGRDPLEEHVKALVAVQVALNEQKHAAQRTGIVLVLWDRGCVSRSFELPLDSASYAFELECYQPVPEGAWIVAHGCQLVGVHIGSDAHDLGPQPKGKLIRLRVPLPLGQRMQIELRQDVPTGAGRSRYG